MVAEPKPNKSTKTMYDVKLVELSGGKRKEKDKNSERWL
jgi:hypothetical protein